MSANSKTKKQELADVLGVSWIEILAAGITILLLGGQAILSAVLNDSTFSRYTDSVITSVSGAYERVTNTTFAANAFTMLVWGVIGLVLYSSCWMLIVMILDVRSDMVISQYFVHTKSFHQSTFWLAAISRRILWITFYVIALVYGILLLKALPTVYSSLKLTISSGIRRETADTLLTVILFASWFAGWHLLIVVRRLSILMNKRIQ